MYLYHLCPPYRIFVGYIDIFLPLFLHTMFNNMMLNIVYITLYSDYFIDIGPNELYYGSGMQRYCYLDLFLFYPRARVSVSISVAENPS
jgi:hypothetical protein